MMIFNEPVSIARSKYEEELKKYVDGVKSVNDLVGVMTMGSIGAPGLSDLDVICVVKDNFNKKYSNKLSVNHLDKNIFLHGPVIVPESMIEDLQYLIYASNLTDTDKVELASKVRELSNLEKKNLSLAYLVDFTESRLIQYAITKQQDKIDKRAWMTRLWSYVHTQNLCQYAEIKLSEDSCKIIEDITNLRENWLNGNPCNNDYFLNLFYHSEAVAKEVMIAACKESYMSAGSPEIISDPCIFENRNKRIICSSNTSEPYSLIRTLKIRNQTIPFITTYAPVEYAAHLNNYEFPNECFQKHLPVTPKTNTYLEILTKRSRLVYRHNLFLKEKNINYSMKGYLGIPYDFSNPIIRLFYKGYWQWVANINKE
ncbi:hypothetical protein ACSAZK_06075 [Methanosarcina sp. Mfa9]|uniref:hypothetical protein n=1 Tax=Methanosarcina sp. Mfa9 TaxID=3439063 RepID=UPI003F843C41